MHEAQDCIRAHHIHQLVPVVVFESYAQSQCRVPWREDSVDSDYVDHAHLEKVWHGVLFFHNVSTDCEGGRSPDLVQKKVKDASDNL